RARRAVAWPVSTARGDPAGAPAGPRGAGARDPSTERAARVGGRGRFWLILEGLEANERIRDQLALEADHDHALERRELFLVYQPQVALASGRIIGAEALLRWQHPERGVVSPGQFIPLLEESGLIDEVGAWLLEEALRQGQAWAQAGWPLRLAVNLSPRQFRSGALLQQIDTALLRTGFPGERLELEITEGLLLEDRGEIHGILQALRQRGIELALDDFGTGYSALSYLQSFPLQTLKIDRAFVAGIGERPSAEELLRGILGLGYGLGMEIVAEGIENETQAAFLRELGCPRGQGFGLVRPMRAAALTEVLAESKGVAPSYSLS
ncbi:MAG: putative bifunctional diguanylate cyclase/phosphodiesterase, partial [Halorhodospira sp.]